MLVYGANTVAGIRITVCRLKLCNSRDFIVSFAPSVPNKNPSGKITAALPHDHVKSIFVGEV